MSVQKNIDPQLKGFSKLDFIPIQDKINAISYIVDFADDKPIESFSKAWANLLDQNKTQDKSNRFSTSDRAEIKSFLEYIEQFKIIKKQQDGKQKLLEFKEILQIAKQKKISIEDAMIQKEKAKVSTIDNKTHLTSKEPLETKFKPENEGGTRGNKAPPKFELGLEPGPYHESYVKLPRTTEESMSSSSSDKLNTLQENLSTNPTNETRATEARASAIPKRGTKSQEKDSESAVSPVLFEAKIEAKTKRSKGGFNSLFEQLQALVGSKNEEILLTAIVKGELEKNIMVKKDRIGKTMHLPKNDLEKVTDILKQILKKSKQPQFKGPFSGSYAILKESAIRTINKEIDKLKLGPDLHPKQKK